MFEKCNSLLGTAALIEKNISIKRKINTTKRFVNKYNFIY